MELIFSEFAGGRVNFCTIWNYSVLSVHIRGVFQVLEAYGDSEQKSLPLRRVTLCGRHRQGSC